MKKVLYVIIALVVIYLVLCLAGPSMVHVERSAVINAPADVIQGKLSDYNQFNTWSPWAEKDTAMKFTVEGEAGKVGHKYSWEGNKDVGKGTMEITAISADTMKEKLDFGGKGVSDVWFVTKPEGTGTNVTWSMDMNIGFFGRGMMLFFKGKMDKMLGGDFEKGLARLKTVAEASPAPSTANYEVKETNWDAEKTYYGTKTTSLSVDKIPAFFGENLPKIWSDMEKGKITAATPPSCLVFKWDDASMSGDMAAVIGGPADAKIKGWEKYTVPAGKVLQVEYFGNYNKIGEAHGALMKYVKENNLAQGVVIEEYVTDPMKEKDTAKWQTNIYYTIK